MGGRLRRLTALAALPVVVSACGGAGPSGDGEPRVSVRIEESPFRLTLLNDGEAVVRQEPEARLRYRLENGATHRLTDVTSSRTTSAGDNRMEASPNPSISRPRRNAPRSTAAAVS